jgi:hypothetical protein
MPEMWEHEGLRCAGSRLRGDIKEELRLLSPLLAMRVRRVQIWPVPQRTHVCYWHRADIDAAGEHVRFRGVKRTSLISTLLSANDP